MNQYSKYLELENGKERASEVVRKLEAKLPPKEAMASPPKEVKRRNRAKRTFSIYTYKGYRFVFTYTPNGKVAVIRLIPNDGQELSAKTRCPKESQFKAARRLVLILEAEKELDRWARESKKLEG